jgi:TonB family protein
MKMISLFVLLLVFSSIDGWTQAELPSSPVVWERYRIGGQEVSFVFPKLPVVISSGDLCREFQKRSYFAYAENIVYEVTLVSKSKDRFPPVCPQKIKFSPKLFTDRIKEIASGKNASQPTAEQKGGRQVSKFVGETRSLYLFDDTKNNRWVELAVHRRKDSKVNDDFLDSLQFESDEGKSIGEGSPRTLGDSVSHSGQLPDPALGLPESDPLWILGKPRATYTDAARHANEQGSVRLKLTLLANGTVGTITPVTTLNYGLTEQAIAAAKKVVFLPKRINGTPVSVVVTFDYGFNIY